MADEEELDLDEALLDEDENLNELPETPPEGEPKPETPDLTAQLAELRGRLDGGGASDKKLDALVDLATKFMDRQAAPALKDTSAEDDAALENFGKMLEEMVLLKSPKEKAKFFQDSVMEIADRRVAVKVNEVLAQVGGPMADKLGSYSLNTFTDIKRTEMEASPKLFSAIQKNFVFTDQEKSWLATAKNADSTRFLDARWRQAAGDVLFKSAGAKKPAPLGGATGGGNVIQLPGSKRDQRALSELADRLVDSYRDKDGGPLVGAEREKKKAELLTRVMKRQSEAS